MVKKPEEANLPKSQNLLRPNAPKVTTFNKKLVMGIALVAGLVCFFAIITAFTPKTKIGEKVESNELFKNDNTPDEIKKMPSNYSEFQNSDNLDKLDKSEEPLLPVGEPGDFPAPPLKPSYSNVNQENSEKDLFEARKSSIRFGGNNAGATVGNNTGNFATGEQSAGAAAQGSVGDQDEQIAFIKNNQASGNFYAKSTLQSAVSQYELKAGSIIPATLITGINSDLPGRMIGQVRENVYDSTTGRYLLIPQGTKIIGTYDKNVGYNQNRALIVWNRLVFPNGDSLDLEGLTGTDTQGYAGMKDKVNYHTGKLIMGIVLSTVFSAGAKVAAGAETLNPNYGQLAVNGVAQNVSNVGQKIAEKNLNVPPTIEIRPGSKCNILVDKDFILRPYR